MLRRIFSGFLFPIFLMLFFTSPAVSGELDRFTDLEGKIDIAGGTAHIPVMKDAAKNIMNQHPKIIITVAGGGSGVGVQKVAEGLVDIGNAGRPVSAKEQEKYPQLKSFPFAVDGVAPAVNPANTISGLTSVQIQDIFSGKINNWKDVGGDDAEIHIFGRDEASGTRSVFWKKCLNKGTVVESANIVASNGAMKVAVSQDRYALGYMSIGHLDNTVKAINLDGVAPTQENAINGSYPVVRKLFMNTNGAPAPLVMVFIDYILSNESSANISRHGYIPLL